MNTDDFFVLHYGTNVLMFGTHAECLAYQDNNGIDIDSFCWGISTVEQFGNSCYDQGYDDASYETFV